MEFFWKINKLGGGGILPGLQSTIFSQLVHFAILQKIWSKLNGN